MNLNDVIALRRGIYGLGYIYRDAGGNVISTPWEDPRTIQQQASSAQAGQQRAVAAQRAAEEATRTAERIQREYEQRARAEADRRAAEEARRAAQGAQQEERRAQQQARRDRRRVAPTQESPVSTPASTPVPSYVAPLTPAATPTQYIASRPAETQVLPTSAPAAEQPVEPVAPAAAPAPATPDLVAITYDLMIEGQVVGSFTKLEDATAAAVKSTTPGDRFEILYKGKTTGLHVRTSTGSVDVPADINSQVRLMSRDKMGEFVANAEIKTTTSTAWWLLPVAGAAVVMAKIF